MDLDSIKLRDYKDSDYESVLKLNIEFSRFFEDIDPWKKDNQDFLAISRWYLDRGLKLIEENGGKIILAEMNSEVIGFAALYFRKQDEGELLSTIPMKIGHLEALFVVSEYRDKGVGTILIKAAEEYFKSENCTHSELEVFAPNVNARDFYIKHGYVDVKMEMIKTL